MGLGDIFFPCDCEVLALTVRIRVRFGLYRAQTEKRKRRFDMGVL